MKVKHGPIAHESRAHRSQQKGVAVEVEVDVGSQVVFPLPLGI